MAGGTEAAELRPSSPQNTSKKYAFVANPVINRQMLKKARLDRNSNLLPNKSATRPKKSRNVPAARVWAALIQVTSAAVMPKSSPIELVMQRIAPVNMEDCPTATVVVRTKRHSWKRLLKHAGRLP